jgi:cyclic beta-1,2-glucan synthetase
MQQAGIESILGFRLRGATVVLEPCIPRAWPRFEIDFAYHSARYEIAVENPHSVSRGILSAELDGQPLDGPGATVPLVDDGQTHRVRVVLG